MIMRPFYMLRLMQRLLSCVLVGGMPCWFSSCVDDTFGKYGQGASGPLAFAVSVPDGWTEGTSRAATDVSIGKLSQCGGLQQLYLVTEVSDAPVAAVASGAVTRGTPVTSGEEFLNKSFGLSAICYVGGWPSDAAAESQLTTNFAHNLKVTQSGTAWTPTSKLDWMGSGNIRFFAYSPYSEDFNSEVATSGTPGSETSSGSGTSGTSNSGTPGTEASGYESTAFDGGTRTENKGSLTHSEATARGIPTLTYTVPDKPAAQRDLMIAVADVQDRGNSSTVPLNFRHALTAVTVKTGEQMLKGTIKKVTFSNVYGTGVYTFPSSSTGTGTSAATNSSTTINSSAATRTFAATRASSATDASIGSWSIPDGTGTTSFTIEREVSLGTTDTGSDGGNGNTGGSGDSGNAGSSGSNGGSIYVDPKVPVNIVDGEFTLMMIPQELPVDAKLTIVFVDALTNTEHTLEAALSTAERRTTWGIGKKVVYSVSSRGIKVTPVIELWVDDKQLTPSGETAATTDEGTTGGESVGMPELCISGYLPKVKLATYVQVAQAEKGTEYVQLEPTVEYSVDNGTSWSSTVSSTGYSSAPVNVWVPNNTNPEATASDGDGSAVASALFIQGVMHLPQQSAYTKMQKALFKETPSLQGTKENPYDLTQGGETANCYIINKPGYYSFPAIYGNARKSGTIGSGTGGTDNKSAYTGITATDGEGKVNTLDVFVKHDNGDIDNPVIASVADAALVWQDAPNLVTDVNYDAVTNMVHFYVSKETLTQGNAVIAVTDKVVADKTKEDESATILWSWHIWATHYDWANGWNTYKVTSASSAGNGKSYYFAPCNLGYCDSHEGNEERTVKVRCGFEFNGKSEYRVFEFKQPGIEASIAGDNTYFQWGRKDPMLPGIYNAETITYEAVLREDKTLKAGKNEPRSPSGQLTMANKKHYPGIRTFKRGDSSVSIGEAIKNPNVFYMYDRSEGTRREHWHDGTKVSYNVHRIINLWNSTLDQLGSSSNFNSAILDANVVKSVYDPSPAGYHIPPGNAFSGFDGAGNDHVINSITVETASEYVKGWKLKSNGVDFFFPGTGLRDMGEGNINDLDGGGSSSRDHVFYKGKTWPAHAQLSFIASSSMVAAEDGGQCTVLDFDQRHYGLKENGEEYGTKKAPYANFLTTSRNSYGFSVRPVRDNP